MDDFEINQLFSKLDFVSEKAPVKCCENENNYSRTSLRCCWTKCRRGNRHPHLYECARRQPEIKYETHNL